MQTNVKYLQADAQVFLQNGDTKQVSELELRDELLGYDYDGIQVVHVEQRKENAYAVKPHTGYGESYVVGEDQILTLAVADGSVLKTLRALTGFNSLCFDDDDLYIVYISVTDYLNLPICIKRCLYGFYETNGINWEEAEAEAEAEAEKDKDKDKEIPIEPYLAGYWIGRGRPQKSILVDEFVAIKYFEKGVAEKLFERTLQDEQFMYTPTDTFFKAVEGLDKDGIPKCYLHIDDDQRCDFFCGFSEGSIKLGTDPSVILLFNSHKLAKDVVSLVRSLGFGVWCKETSGWIGGVQYQVKPILDNDEYSGCIQSFETSEFPTVYPFDLVRVGERDICRVALAGGNLVVLDDLKVV